MKKDWRLITGFEKYAVSDSGEVISIQHGEWRPIKGNIIKGYESVGIRNADGKRIHVKRHRLVAKMFVENPNNLPVVNHLDGNKFNHHYSNLEWTTAKENSTHAASIGKYLWGSKLVLNIETGIFYNTLKEAYKFSGLPISLSYFRHMINGLYPNKTKFIAA